MKEVIVIALCFIVLLIWTDIKEHMNVTGRIVYKEYIPGHMSNVEPKIVAYSAYVPVVCHTPPAPHFVESEFIIYVADKNKVYAKHVDSLKFEVLNVGQKLTITL